jgi:hypothetical protein
MCRVLKLDISSTEKLVLMAMADHAHKDGTGCYASVDTLAEETSLTRRAVQLTIDKLEVVSLIVAIGKVRGGRRVPNSEFGRGVTMEYKITLDAHFPRPETNQKDKTKGRTTFTLLSIEKGEPRSQKGCTTFAGKGELRSPESKTLNLKPKPAPLPPVNGGLVENVASHDDLLKDEKNYGLMMWGNQTIIVRTGRHRRILSKNDAEAFVGARVERMVEHLRSKGFWAEVYTLSPTGAGKNESTNKESFSGKAKL